MKTTTPLAIALSAICAVASQAAPQVGPVVRPAPDFTWTGGKSLRSLQNQPVVLLIARSPKDSAFRKELKRLQEQYQEFGSQNAVFVAAFTRKDGEVKSNIPFLIAGDGPGIATKYGVKKPFGLAVIGRDGNVDLITEKVVPASRVMDAIVNGYDVQAPERR